MPACNNKCPAKQTFSKKDRKSGLFPGQIKDALVHANGTRRNLGNTGTSGKTRRFDAPLPPCCGKLRGIRSGNCRRRAQIRVIERLRHPDEMDCLRWVR